jgi:pilus assembly protein CpaC
LFNDERERVRTGVPLLMNIPILGALFSSTRWQSSETELLVIVTPTIIDPAAVGGEFTLPIQRETRVPALDVLKKRLPADTSRTPQ